MRARPAICEMRASDRTPRMCSASRLPIFAVYSERRASSSERNELYWSGDNDVLPCELWASDDAPVPGGHPLLQRSVALYVLAASLADGLSVRSTASAIS